MLSVRLRRFETHVAAQSQQASFGRPVGWQMMVLIGG